jgi:histone deacetylase 1/2
VHRTRSTTGNRRPKTGLSTFSNEPETLQMALENPDWKHAMNDEYKALVENKTWHLVPYKKGINLIDCKWVYRIKKKLMEPLIGMKID